jgi:O-antigen/teichoic acid export membrane protein
VKYSENVLGSNNAILYNTDLYRVTLWLGLALAILAFLLNIWLIPLYGIMGAAIATCVAFTLYSLSKVLYVNMQLGMHPWTPETSKSIVLIATTIAVFYFWDFSWNVYLNIGLKTILITAFYMIVVQKWKLSEEINELISKVFARLTAT